MHSDKVWIVIVLVIVILAGSNLAMFAMVRGMRGGKHDWLGGIQNANQPWKKEDEGLKELNERVKALQHEKEEKENESQS